MQALIRYEKFDSQQGVSRRVGYNHIIFNKHEDTPNAPKNYVTVHFNVFCREWYRLSVFTLTIDRQPCKFIGTKEGDYIRRVQLP